MAGGAGTERVKTCWSTVLFHVLASKAYMVMIEHPLSEVLFVIAAAHRVEVTDLQALTYIYRLTGPDIHLQTYRPRLTGPDIHLQTYRPRLTGPDIHLQTYRPRLTGPDIHFTNLQAHTYRP